MELRVVRAVWVMRV